MTRSLLGAIILNGDIRKKYFGHYSTSPVMTTLSAKENILKQIANEQSAFPLEVVEPKISTASVVQYIGDRKIWRMHTRKALFRIIPVRI